LYSQAIGRNAEVDAQLWHAGIVIAIILHYRAIFAAHNVRYEYSCAMPDAGMPVGEVVEKGWWMAMRALGLASA